MDTPLLGVIAPHPPIAVLEVGGERAHVTDATAAALRSAAERIRAFAPETLVLMSPHAPVAPDTFVIDDSGRVTGDLGTFGAPEVRIAAPGDPDLARAIVAAATDEGLSVTPRSASPLLEPGILDHGALVPLSFLDREGRYRVVELSLSFLPLSHHRRLGRAVRRAAESLGRRVVFVASGDCSHRLKRDAPAGYSPRGAEFDAALLRAIERGDLDGLQLLDPDLIEAAGECGLRSFVTLSGYLADTRPASRVLSYEGPWGVGYLTALAGDAALMGAEGSQPSGRDESPPVALARETIETFVRTRRVLVPEPPVGILATRSGAFVSLHRDAELRGCIGTIEPTQGTLADEIVHNAIQAATADPRFAPIGASELDDLEISVDVLHPAEPARLEDLDPRLYGVIVEADWRRGLLLPDLKGVDTVEEQVAIALRKAGIAPHERFRLSRFRVERFH